MFFRSDRKAYILALKEHTRAMTDNTQALADLNAAIGDLTSRVEELITKHAAAAGSPDVSAGLETAAQSLKDMSAKIDTALAPPT